MERVLIALRHGQSTANAAGVFGGWADVPLTARGEQEAAHAARLLQTARVSPDVVHTSVLRRSVRTAEIVLDALSRSWLPVRRSWRLNERQYGALAGRRKTQVRAEVGEERYRKLRRSLREAPEPLSAEEYEALAADPRYAHLAPGLVPAAESLADVKARVVPYWADAICPDLYAGRQVLLVAHGNSLRALVAHLEGLDEEAIEQLNIPTGIPLRYAFDDDLTPRGPGRYLDPQAAAQAAAAVSRE